MFLKIKEGVFINLNNVCDISFEGFVKENEFRIVVTYNVSNSCVTIHVDEQTYKRIEEWFNRNKVEV